MVTVAKAKRPPSRPQDTVEYPGIVSIPLAEFGKSLADPDLDRWFEGFAGRNKDEGQYEISKEGYLLIMPPTGSPGAFFEFDLGRALGNWACERGGRPYPPTSRFVMPDGSRYGPDVAWVSEERRAELVLPENRPFSRIMPEFVAEIRSPSNTRAELFRKLAAFIEAGTKLGWYIDPYARRVVIFRPGREPETLEDPEYIDGDSNVLPGFRFAVRRLIFDVQADFDAPETTRDTEERHNAAEEQGSPD